MTNKSIFSDCLLKELSYNGEQDHQQEDSNTQTQLNLLNDQKIAKKTIEEEYHNYFSIVSKQLESFKIQQLPKQSFQKHQIKIISSHSTKVWKRLIDQGNTYVQFHSCRHVGTQCIYDVVVGMFFLTVKVLNLHVNSIEAQTSNEQLGEGSFGQVKKLRLGDRDIALKRIIFNKNHQKKLSFSDIFNPDDNAGCYQIRKAISQYCLYKICSMLKIGPQVIFENCYDLVCYNDCIQFQMQICQQIPRNVDFNIYEHDLKKCLKILHSLKIIHKDIKKPNTLYSPTYKSFVLSDFGLTHSVKQNFWQKTQTYFGGSPTHASPQMKKLLYNKQIGSVNLYMNDIYCLNVTLQQLKQQLQQLQYSLLKNDMSFNEHIYGSDSGSYTGSFQIIEEFNSNQKQINSSSMNSQQQSETLSMMNANQYKKNQQDIIHQIGYYHIKSLHEFFKIYQQQKKQNVKIFLQNIVSDLIKKEKNVVQLKSEILRITVLNYQKIYGENSLLTNIRNTARIFGINSKQVYDSLVQLNTKRTIKGVNYSKLQNYLNTPYKYNKIPLKKFKNHIINMDRHLCLRNTRSLAKTLRTLISSYSDANYKTNKEKLEILRTGLYVLSFQQLSQIQCIQFVITLWKIFKNKEIKPQQVNMECYLELFDQIFKQFSKQNNADAIILSSLIKMHFKFHSRKSAQFYYQKTIQFRQTLQKKLESIKMIQTDQITKKQDIIKFMICQIRYLQLTNKIEQSLQNSIKAYNKFTEYQINNQQMIITILDKIVSNLTKLNRFQQAQIYIQKAREVIQKHCFPKKTSIQFAFYYSFKGIILNSKNNHIEALKNFQIVLQSTTDTLRGPKYISLTQQTLKNIAVCYGNLNQPGKALYYLQKCLQLSLNYLKFEQYQQPITIIHHIIVWFFKIKKFDSQLAQYINKLISLKVQLLQSKRFNASLQHKRQAPAFDLSVLKTFCIQQQSCVVVKKMIIASSEYYLPTFITWYTRVCSQICYYYINEKKTPSKALPYCWKMFRCIPMFQRNQELYKSLDLYIHLLIRINSTRRAYKYLKQYFAQIPQQYQALRIEASKRLASLSSDLETKDQQFYKFIHKQKAVRNRDYLKTAQQKIQYLPINNFIKKIWSKKINKIQNYLIEDIKDENSPVLMPVQQQNPENSQSSRLVLLMQQNIQKIPAKKKAKIIIK